MKISVIIPTYNSAIYLARAIESVLCQTYETFEIIVIDDGSTDNTENVLEEYMKKGNIRYIYQENSGPSAARNHGIKEARGEYIAFLDSDDEWISEKLEKQIKLLNKSNKIGLVTCGSIVIDEIGNENIKLPKIPLLRQKMIEAFIFGNIVGSCSYVMVRKECFDKIGYFDEYLKVGEDWDLWMRIAKEFDIVSINESLVKYYIRKNSQSSSGFMNLDNELKLLKKIFNDINMPNKQILKNRAYSYRYYKAAIAFKEVNNREQAKICIFKSFYLYPFYVLNKSYLGVLLYVILGDNGLKVFDNIKNFICKNRKI